MLQAGEFKLRPGVDFVSYEELKELRLEDGLDVSRKVRVCVCVCVCVCLCVRVCVCVWLFALAGTEVLSAMAKFTRHGCDARTLPKPT